MTYVALALAAVLAVTIGSFAGVLRSRDRAHARERDLMLNKLLHLAGKPWQEAPAVETRGKRDMLVDVENGRYVSNPETLPDY